MAGAVAFISEFLAGAESLDWVSFSALLPKRNISIFTAQWVDTVVKVPLQKRTVRGPTQRREKEMSKADLTTNGGDIGMLGRMGQVSSEMHKFSCVSNIGPSGVHALPLAAGINEGGHYFRYFVPSVLRAPAEQIR